MIDIKYCYYIHFGIRFCQAFDCGGAQMTHLQRVIRNEGGSEKSFLLLSMNRNVDSYQEKGNNFHRKYYGLAWVGCRSQRAKWYFKLEYQCPETCLRISSQTLNCT